MKEIEHFLKGKSREAGSCEDALFVGNDFVAAIDGVTTKGTPGGTVLQVGVMRHCFFNQSLQQFQGIYRHMSYLNDCR